MISVLHRNNLESFFQSIRNLSRASTKPITFSQYQGIQAQPNYLYKIIHHETYTDIQCTDLLLCGPTGLLPDYIYEQILNENTSLTEVINLLYNHIMTKQYQAHSKAHFFMDIAQQGTTSYHQLTKLNQRPCSLAHLQEFLCYYFQLSIKLNFEPLTKNQRSNATLTLLGKQNHTLGDTFALGKDAVFHNKTLTITIGPVDLNQYRGLKPKKNMRACLLQLAQKYTNNSIKISVKTLLKKPKTTYFFLNGHHELGFTSWLD